MEIKYLHFRRRRHHHNGVAGTVEILKGTLYQTETM